MKTKALLKGYNWVLDGLGALVMIVAFILMLVYKDEVGDLVVRLTGLGIIFFTLVRIKPILANRNEKDYVLVMFTEMLISFVIGVLLLFLADKFQDTSKFLDYSTLLGIVLWLRGICHFWTTSKRYEYHDIIAFVINVLFISFGFLFLITDVLNEDRIALFLLIICGLLTVFFGYRTFTGYNRFRIQKVNALKMNEYLEKQEEKEEVIEDPKTIEEKINPKIIEEPQEEKRPSVDIN